MAVRWWYGGGKVVVAVAVYSELLSMTEGEGCKGAAI